MEEGRGPWELTVSPGMWPPGRGGMVGSGGSPGGGARWDGRQSWRTVGWGRSWGTVHVRHLVFCIKLISAFSICGLNFFSPHGLLLLPPWSPRFCVSGPSCFLHLRGPVCLHCGSYWTCTLLVPVPVPSYLACPTVDGKWQAWASWGGCSVTCGGGTQRRERICSGPFFGGAACQGPQDEFRQCSAQRCPGECSPSPPQLGSRRAP